MKTPDSIHTGFVRGKQIGSKITSLPGAVVFGLGYATGVTGGVIVGATTAVVAPIAAKFQEGMRRAKATDNPIEDPAAVPSATVQPPSNTESSGSSDMGGAAPVPA